ncbi:sigma-54 dependent signal transduction protein [Desulforapulum autotrophicum HRM2]|uniref:Sigma-54 dependent signal transduction protein n=1 Tax=Desulforapulum autotrophicum (strain ATCC 43914 / DSM 3382 / VKM B-1955 / HRM2) TaxID=177437 RepID=C0QGL0_DESAH|nr:sigma-54-dependent Fis family transcriptional regulator [Desulforapulum autotrophicum]ACN13485.1 sigma-54 dependent signal transduction protein [Desulforapulum autotrophicum HRM2]
MPQYDKETIALQWRNLQAGKPVDSQSIRTDILVSWKHSKNLGIDAHKGLHHKGDGDALLKRSAELVSVAQPFMEVINEIIAGSGFRIDCIDHEGFFLCSCGDPTLLKESEYNGFVTGCDVSIEAIGTNAAGLSLSLKKPVQVFGPEHYNINLHNLNCSATPIYTPDSELVGILNILSYDTPQNRQTLGLTTSIAKAIENQLALTRTVTSLKVSNSELNTIMEYLPQGVIALNKLGEVDRYNKKALEMLSIPQKSGIDQRKNQLKKNLSALDLSRELRRQKEKEHTIAVGSRKKSFVVNAHSIENGERTLVMLEDTGRIMSLSAVQSNRTSYTFNDITGRCAGIIKAKELATMVAPTDSSVLLVGESGTGKELFAQAIHASSCRSNNPFVAINCGAIPADIIESELFGYEPGAFTGAREAGKAGRLETASGGTLFLDEVEAMPLSFQVKLLRAFSSKSMVRVGGVNEIPLDLRIISASKVDLIEEANQGRFREDLYYRIATFPILIPPLNKRGGDIRLLAKQFLKQLSAEYLRSDIYADNDFFEALQSYPWRGNVRELRNTIERAVVIGLDQQQLTPAQLPQSLKEYWISGKLRQHAKTTLNHHPTDKKSLLKIAEDTTIAMVLEEEKGNISRSAKRLGIARSTLYQKIETSDQILSVVKSDT